MKKLGKITINPEKVIKNEELVNLKGGGYGMCTVYCDNTLYSAPYRCPWEMCSIEPGVCDCFEE